MVDAWAACCGCRDLIAVIRGARNKAVLPMHWLEVGRVTMVCARCAAIGRLVGCIVLRTQQTPQCKHRLGFVFYVLYYVGPGIGRDCSK